MPLLNYENISVWVCPGTLDRDGEGLGSKGNGTGIQGDGQVGAGLSQDAAIGEAACPGDGVVGAEDGQGGAE